jgi:hypothetical protein
VSVTTVTATGTAAVDSLEAVFDTVTPIDLSLVFTGWGPLPAITHVEEQSGPWDHVGVHRRPQFADGGSAMEKMTHYLRPGYFAYEVTGFTNAEEEAVGLTDVVPFLIEDEFQRLGGLYEKGADWGVHVVVDGRLVTGQNPASSEEAAKALLGLFGK